MNHRPGMVRLLGAAVLLVSLAVPAARAQNPNPAVYEPLIVPISVQGVHGAFGSSWSTELWYRNNSSSPVQIFPLFISDWVPAKNATSFLPILSAPSYAPGVLLYMTRAGAEHIQFDLRLFNAADRSANWGTKLPVVREIDLAPRIDLINVPTDPQFRTALRIYALAEGAPADTRVRVEVRSLAEELLASTETVLTGSPLYAQILPLIDDASLSRRFDRVNVRVQPADPALKIWAFASVTANATQHVAIVTPE